MERKTKITLFTIGAVVGGGYLLYEFLLKDIFIILGIIIATVYVGLFL